MVWFLPIFFLDKFILPPNHIIGTDATVRVDRIRTLRTSRVRYGIKTGLAR
jgi:hypothetical protein